MNAFLQYLIIFQRTAGNATVVIRRLVSPTLDTSNKSTYCNLFVLETPLRKISRVSVKFQSNVGKYVQFIVKNQY